MRVHLGSDHAGLELKDHLMTGWSTTATSPSTTARSSTTPGRLPGLLPPRGRGRRGRRADGMDSLGVVIGGSGNGEQIAANKVEGVRCRAGLVRGDRAAGARAQRRQRRLRRRPDALARGHDPLRRGLPRRPRSASEERHVRRIGLLPTYERTASSAAAGVCPPGRPERRARMPEGHTLHRLADDLDGDVRRHAVVRVSSPQGRFAEPTRRSRRPAARRRRVRRQAPVRRFRATTGSHVHLGLFGKFDVRAGVAEVPPPVGQVRLRLA